MTENSNSPCENELNEIKRLLWGPYVKDEVFERWAQGFQFSKEEPTALVQWEGGPCAVIAAVQSFILKIILSGNVGNNWRQVEAEESYRLLVKALCEILSQANSQCSTRGYSLVHVPYGCSSQISSERLNGGENCIQDVVGAEASKSQSPELLDSNVELIADSGLKRKKLEHQHFHSQL
ncbi:hypothetical protein J437_LFUL000037, partial [Ladona fulva]